MQETAQAAKSGLLISVTKSRAMSPERSQQIDDAAGRWLVQRDSGEWSPQDAAAFETWMSESMAHRVAYWRLEDAWEKAQRLKALGAGIRSEEPPPAGYWNISADRASRPEPVAPRRNAFRIRAWAASLAVVAIAGVAAYLWQSAHRFRTGVGEVVSVPIPDGSKVTLNTASAIKVAMTSRERRIELERGEAFFEVAQEPARPFVVVAGDKRVGAIGTKFSVRKAVVDPARPAQADDIQIVVTEGAVRVEAVGSQGSKLLSKEPLTAGSLAWTSGKELTRRQAAREAVESLSWRSGTLVFRDVSLAQAAAEFNRYNERKIVIDDAAAADLRIAGSFRTTSAESFVDIIERGYPVRGIVHDGKIVISSAK